MYYVINDKYTYIDAATTVLTGTAAIGVPSRVAFNALFEDTFPGARYVQLPPRTN
jgi:hypothetical protein